MTFKKFLSLREDQRLRKLWRWLWEFEQVLRARKKSEEGGSRKRPLLAPGNPETYRQLFFGFRDCLYETAPSRLAWERLLTALPGSAEELWAVNELRHSLASLIGKEAADWDLFSPPEDSPALAPEGSPDAPTFAGESGPFRGTRRVFCDDIRSPFNLGSIFRTAEALGFSELILSPACPSVKHPRVRRSALGSIERIAWRVASFEEILAEPGIRETGFFALELGGRAPEDFSFAESALVVLGSEELGVHPRILEACDASLGRLTLPLYGTKASLNVGVSFGICGVLWNQALKRNGVPRVEAPFSR